MPPYVPSPLLELNNIMLTSMNLNIGPLEDVLTVREIGATSEHATNCVAISNSKISAKNTRRSPVERNKIKH